MCEDREGGSTINMDLSTAENSSSVSSEDLNSSDRTATSLLDLSSSSSSNNNELDLNLMKTSLHHKPLHMIEDRLSQLFYEGADVTIYNRYLLIMQHSLRHCLTKQATSDLLKLVGMLLPTKSMVSHYNLQKYFLDLYDELTFTKCF